MVDALALATLAYFSRKYGDQSLMYDELEYLLRQRKEKIIYVPNDGNAGDSFIAHATYQFLDRLRVPYTIGNLHSSYPNQTIICGGGGNLVPYYHSMVDFIRRNQGAWRELIILPHTIRGHSEVLCNLQKNCYVFCREKPSYEFVQKCAPHANIFLSHDLAFSCDFEQTKKQMSLYYLHYMIYALRHFRSTWRHARSVQREVARAAKTRKQPDVLNAFRTDLEMTAIDVPEDNIDVSHVFTTMKFLPIEALHTTFVMLRFIEQFQVVRTNRLHVAIMSAMLGLEVYFYDNSYGKNRDVYIHSMQGRFPNVHWQLPLTTGAGTPA